MNAPLENPYAVPVGEGTAPIPTAPPPYGWEVRDGRLLAEDVAMLPMIDPFTGMTRERMTRVRVRVRCRPLWLWIFPLGLPLSAIFAQPADRVWAAFFMLTLGLLTRAAAGLVPRPCELRIFVIFRTYQQRRNLTRGLQALFWISLVASIELFGLSPGFPVMGKWLFQVWLVLLALVLLLQRRPCCWMKRDGLFEIRGLHPEALSELAAVQGNPAAIPGTGPGGKGFPPADE